MIFLLRDSIDYKNLNTVWDYNISLLKKKNIGIIEILFPNGIILIISLKKYPKVFSFCF